MPIFLADPPQWVYLVLGGLLVVTGAIAAQRQDRRTAVAFGIAFLLMLAVFLIDRTNESPREEAERRTHTLAMSADAKNPDAFAEHLADKVTIQTGNGEKTLTRDEIKKHPFWGTLRGFDVTIAVADFSREDVKEIDENNVELGFVGKGTPKNMQTIPFYLRGTFTKQPDGSRKLTALRVYDFLERKKLATIPGFP
jgi:hypothetical protein